MRRRSFVSPVSRLPEEAALMHKQRFSDHETVVDAQGRWGCARCGIDKRVPTSEDLDPAAVAALRPEYNCPFCDTYCPVGADCRCGAMAMADDFWPAPDRPLMRSPRSTLDTVIYFAMLSKRREPSLSGDIRAMLRIKPPEVRREMLMFDDESFFS